MKGNSGAVTLKTCFKCLCLFYSFEDSQVPQCIVSWFSSALCPRIFLLHLQPAKTRFFAQFPLKRYLKLLFKNPAPVRCTFVFFKFTYISAFLLSNVDELPLRSRQMFNFAWNFHLADLRRIYFLILYSTSLLEVNWKILHWYKYQVPIIFLKFLHVIPIYEYNRQWRIQGGRGTRPPIKIQKKGQFLEKKGKFLVKRG